VARAARETVYLEHQMAGRARLRVPKPRTPKSVVTVARRIGRAKRVRQVDANQSTGSLLVSFSADDPIDLIVDDLRAVGIEVVAAIRPMVGPVRTQSTGAAVVRQVMGKANEQLHQITEGKVDLRLVVPAIYLTLGVRNLLIQRARLRDATWYQLLYWSFDSFFKLHQESSVTGAAGSHGRLLN
jgi:hypothetical protein